MDEFLSIEDLRWEFGASRAWTYKYLAPHIKSITLTLPVVETRGFSVLRGLPSGTGIVL